MTEPANSSVGEARLLITLKISHIGWQIRGLGPGAYDPKNVVQDKKLIDFLNELQGKMLLTQKTLNKRWKVFDKNNLFCSANSATIETCLRHAARAFATTLELHPYCDVCRYGPTDPLYVVYIQRLEEIFTKCFTVAWMYGNPEQSMVGLCGLLTDFQINGGVDMKDGGEGGGMAVSLYAYHRAHFEPNNREPIVYQKFTEMLRKLSETVKRSYPKCRIPLAGSIGRMISGPCFNRTDITSPTKTEALQCLADIVDDLASPGKAPQANYAEPSAVAAT